MTYGLPASVAPAEASTLTNDAAPDAGPATHGRVLLRDLDWSIGPGDRIGILGVNGSGKTTLCLLYTSRCV